MSDDASTGRWSHRALNLILGALGLVVMVLLYALVSRHLGGGAAPRDARPSAAESSSRRTQVEEEEPADRIIQVGVRNGCGESGLAAEVRDFLVREGFDVVEVGNYTSFDVDTSLVIDRVGNRAAARRAARAMGISTGQVRQETGGDYYLDASVVIGCDYRTLSPFQGRRDARASSTPGSR